VFSQSKHWSNPFSGRISCMVSDRTRLQKLFIYTLLLQGRIREGRIQETFKTYKFLTHPSLIFLCVVTAKAKWSCVKNVRAHPPRTGCHKGRRACHGRSVAPVPLEGRSARVAGRGSRVWACTRCRLVAFPDHLAYRRQTPLVSLWSGKRQMVRKRDLTGGSDEQRAADDHRRCFADPPGQAWLRSISQAPHATPELSRWCRA